MSKPPVPGSWEVTSLGSVTEYGRVNKAEPNDIEDSAWVLELEDIEKNTSKLLSRISFVERQSKSTKNRFEVGDVLYGKLRPYLNKVVIADALGYCTTEIIPLKAGDHLDNRYLFYWLKHPAFLDYVEAESHGLNMPRLGTETGRAAPFVLAPLNEQKRIADKLDAVLARVDACRDRLDRIPAILKHFRQSVLAAATSGSLTEDWRLNNLFTNTSTQIEGIHAERKLRRGALEKLNISCIPETEWEFPEHWARVSAAVLLSKGIFIDIKDGNHGANHPRVEDFSSTGLTFITAAQVNNFRVDYNSAHKISGIPLEKIRVGFAKAGDVVLTHKGTVGRVAIIDRDCVLTPQTTYYRTNPSFILPKYLMFYLASKPFKDQLDEIKSQTTRDFVPISQQNGLWHLLPPIEEQTEIVRRVESLFAYADRLEARYTAARTQVEKLTPALLAKAFRGELVAQDPNDEPASELLARIAASKSEAQPKKPAGRKRKNQPQSAVTLNKFNESSK